ncbi:monovalent cation:H+ antiporter-2, CPA2 family [Lebetimonas natsushimae]|uniref:Monovalent cation:H+ antiporter-2, CPA2 family n=1 Tax=Lebetimonas natsushimae TaxID=1936991 RepID=A0A292Y9P4_9BACT|nr:cation:proton antiporter [Lebetimonas natsushimae]GAX87622.1 monovalent cation:H+ antiporter-2, CPA2 family [Lebetimonas natsushimae]
MISPILIVIVLLFIALLFNIPLAKFKVPPIIGYIFTGIIITNLFHIDHKTIELVAEIGIVFLMFLIGLEFSPEKLKSMKKEVFLYGFLEMSLVGIFFGVFFWIVLDVDLRVSFILGSAIALSSTAIILKLLNESHEISKPYGKLSLGILLFQDIAVIPILIAISIIVNKDTPFLPLVLKTVEGFIGLGLFIYIFGKYIAPFIITQATKTKSDEIFLATVLLVVLTAAETAHFFGLSYSLGAFLAGMILSETKYKYQIEADLVPFRDLLLGIFFVSVGLMVDIHFVIHNLFSILLITITFMLSKAFLIYLMLFVFVRHKRVAIKSAFILSQIGEFAFVIFALLGRYFLVDESLLQKLIVATVISMILTPFIVKYIYKIADLFDKNIQGFEEYEIKSAGANGHIILIGYDKIGQRIARKLNNQLIPYVAIDKQIELVKEGLKKGDNVIFGNAANKRVLESLDIENACAVIITTQNEEHTHMIVENILDINPNLNIIVLSDDENEVNYYKEKNIYVVDKSKELAEKLISLALKCELK